MKMKKWLKQVLPKDFKQSKSFGKALSLTKYKIIHVDIYIEKSMYDEIGEYVFIIAGGIESSLSYGNEKNEILLFEASVKGNTISSVDNFNEVFHFNGDQLEQAEKVLKEIIVPWCNYISTAENLIPFVKSQFMDVSVTDYSENTELISSIRNKYPKRALTQGGMSMMYELYLLVGQENEAKKILQEYIKFIELDWKDFPEQEEYLTFLNEKLVTH